VWLLPAVLTQHVRQIVASQHGPPKAFACDENLALISWSLRHWLPSALVALLGNSHVTLDQRVRRQVEQVSESKADDRDGDVRASLMLKTWA
jgi:hypothetical protein